MNLNILNILLILGLTRGILQNIRVKSVVESDGSMSATSLAALADGVLLRADNEVCLWVVTFWAQHKLPDEPIEKILKFGSIV